MIGFYRACPYHLLEINEDLECPEGHHCATWLVKGDDGSVIAKAKEEYLTILVGDELKPKPKKIGQQKKPMQPCKHGHNNWSYQPSTMRWRCRTCNRNRSRIENPRTRAKKARANEYGDSQG